MQHGKNLKRRFPYKLIHGDEWKVSECDKQWITECDVKLVRNSRPPKLLTRNYKGLSDYARSSRLLIPLEAFLNYNMTLRLECAMSSFVRWCHLRPILSENLQIVVRV